MPSPRSLVLRSCLEKRAGKMADLHKKYQESGLAFTDIQKRPLSPEYQDSHRWHERALSYVKNIGKYISPLR